MRRYCLIILLVVFAVISAALSVSEVKVDLDKRDPPTPSTPTCAVLGVLVAQSVAVYNNYGVGAVTVWTTYALFTWDYVADQWSYIYNQWDDGGTASSALANARLVVNENSIVWVAGTVAATSYWLIAKLSSMTNSKKEMELVGGPLIILLTMIFYYTTRNSTVNGTSFAWYETVAINNNTIIATRLTPLQPDLPNTAKGKSKRGNFSYTQSGVGFEISNWTGDTAVMSSDQVNSMASKIAAYLVDYMNNNTQSGMVMGIQSDYCDYWLGTYYFYVVETSDSGY
ncbi:uncharacterized protein RJT21DRAFT_139978 [Scheffersomyces amazonensis]|uniref:uncharacterized protein n=1 Tax=Scheffersomyces amazonensis TaxID=1078765 RepID=UPI00315DD09D